MLITAPEQSRRVTNPAPCPRADCRNPLTRPAQIICTGDFVALAGMCRGKKRLGQPVADRIAADRGCAAYQCELCRQYHNGREVADRPGVLAVTRTAVQALRADPRVGPAGLLQLADAWHPDNVNRSCWSEGLDQAVAVVVR